MNEKHPVDSLMQSTMENLRNMIDVNTVIGEKIETSDGTSIIPISKVTFGFASGGSEFQTPAQPSTSSLPFGGASGAGVTVKPIAFLVTKDGFVKLVPVEGSSSYDRLIDLVPQMLDGIKNLFPNSKKQAEPDIQTDITITDDNDIDIEISSQNEE